MRKAILIVGLCFWCATAPVQAGDVCPANPQTRTEKGAPLSQTDSDNWLGNVRFMCQNDVTMTNDWDFGTGILEIPNSTTRPATCDVGDIYMDTDEASGQRLYLCESTNTWVLQGDGGTFSTIDTDYGIETVTSAWTVTGDWDFSGGGIEIENGITPPACTDGQIYLDTDATSGQRLMACEAGAFVVQGDGAGSGASAGASGDVQYSDGASGFVAEAAFNYNATLNILALDEVRFDSNGTSCAADTIGISLAADTDTGLIEGIDGIGVCDDTDYIVDIGQQQLAVSSQTSVVWSSNTDMASGIAADVGLRRIGVGRLLVTDGGAAGNTSGRLHTMRSVEANTAGAGAPNAIIDDEVWRVFTNEGTAAENHHDLPSAAAGYTYTFCVQDTDGMQINAATADTIRIEASVSASAGDISSTTVGSCVTLVAINAVEWFATSFTGTWVVN